MKTFFVRACKKKKKKGNTFETWTTRNEKMGFVKIQVKRVKLKRNRKSLFPRLTSSIPFIPLHSLYPVPFPRVLDVHASTIRALAGNVHRRAFPSSILKRDSFLVRCLTRW